MADVFISYKREDQRWAAAVDTALKNRGFSVWWDPSIQAGEYFDESIERELTAAKAVVVLWSNSSIKSQWVKAEAISAFGRGALVSARLDEVELGFPFQVVQAANLRGWNGKSEHPGLTDLVDGVSQKVRREARITASLAEAPEEPRKYEDSSWSTGLSDLDRMIGNFAAGSLIVVAARPSMGKSALVSKFALNVARQVTDSKSEAAVLYFSLDSPVDDFGVTLLAMAGRFSAHRLRRGKISRAEYEALADTAQALNEIPIEIDDSSENLDGLVAKVLDSTRTPAMVVIDSITMLGGASGGDLKEVGKRLKLLARQIRAPIVVTAGISEDVESRSDKRPRLSDVSNELQELADCVLGLYRERVYLEREEPEEGTNPHFAWQRQMDGCLRAAEIVVLKQRQGPVGRVRVQFVYDYLSFEDLGGNS